MVLTQEGLEAVVQTFARLVTLYFAVGVVCSAAGSFLGNRLAELYEKRKEKGKKK